MIASVILLNWNGWKDTIECLESVLRLNYPSLRIVVCDNSSTDGSLERIKDWARGNLAPTCDNQDLSRLVLPPVRKPLPFRELTREEAETGGSTYEDQLVLIQNGANLGFAGGCNVGLRHALGDNNCQYFWLLNNDTIVEPDALSAMIHVTQERPEVGLCGSLNLSYYEPEFVQARGGMSYSRWTARVGGPRLSLLDRLTGGSERMDYVNGASMLVSRAFLEAVGLMEESYFLYFEELDWAMRARGMFALDYCPKSVIYHKEGSSIGTHRNRKKRSLLADKYLSRNRVLFTKRYFPWALPTVMFSVCLAAAFRMSQGDRERAKAMLAFMLRGLTTNAGPRDLKPPQSRAAA